jgi:N-acetylneuraminic acid mutarotase
MIVFGGWRITTPRYLGDAKAYDPTTDTWSNISTVGKPSNRGRHTAVWTGSKMIVWGGAYGTTTPTVRYNNGAIYDPSDDTWQALPTAGAPVARSNHTAAWSGDSMYIWGGYDGSNFLNSGATFRPIDP